MKIIFEDHGQDFLEFTVQNSTGRIIDCKPFQFSIWSKYKVTNTKTLFKGGQVELSHLIDGTTLTIKYTIEEIIL